MRHEVRHEATSEVRLINSAASQIFFQTSTGRGWSDRASRSSVLVSPVWSRAVPYTYQSGRTTATEHEDAANQDA